MVERYAAPSIDELSRLLNDLDFGMVSLDAYHDHPTITVTTSEMSRALGRIEHKLTLNPVFASVGGPCIGYNCHIEKRYCGDTGEVSASVDADPKPLVEHEPLEVALVSVAIYCEELENPAVSSPARDTRGSAPSSSPTSSAGSNSPAN